MTAAPATTPPSGGSLLQLPDAANSTEESRAFVAGVRAQMRGDLFIARDHFEAALRANPRYVLAILGLAGLELQRKDFEAAEALMQRAEQIGSDRPEVAMARGRVQMARNDFEGAEQAFRRSMALAPKLLPARIDLGNLYLRTARPKEALEVFREASGIDPRNKLVAFGLGAAAAGAGQRDEAIRALTLAAELAPADVAPWHVLGRIHLASGATDDALAAFDEGLARDPKHVPAMLGRATALARKDRLTDAINQALAAEQIAPDSPEVRLQVGDLMQAAKRWTEAETRYWRVIELQPRNAVAYNNLAWTIVARNGDAKRAVGLAEQALRLAPNVPPILDTLGWARRAAGDLPGAAAPLEHAVKAAPRVAMYHYHLGIVQSERNLADAARTALNTALSLDLPADEAAEAKRLLARLRR